MGGKDGQLLEAAKKGNTSEALRLIEQEGVNVNCTDYVRRSGEESTARALRVWGGKGKRRQRHLVCICREAEEEERPHATSAGLACGRGTASLPSRPSCRPGS